MGGSPFDLQFNMFAVVCRIKAQDIAVPGDAAFAVALSAIGAGLDWLKTDEVVRQTHIQPFRIVKGRRRRAPRLAGLGIVIGVVLAENVWKRNIAFEEAPGGVEQQVFSVSLGRGQVDGRLCRPRSRPRSRPRRQPQGTGTLDQLSSVHRRVSTKVREG